MPRFTTENFVSAKSLYQSVLAAEPNNYQAAYRLGITNDYLEDYPEALKYYRKASEIDPERNDTVFLYIGLTYKKLNNYRKAKEAFLEFQQRHEVEDEYYKRAQLEIEGCDLAVATPGKRARHRDTPLTINSNALDAFPLFWTNDRKMFSLYLPPIEKREGREIKRTKG